MCNMCTEKKALLENAKTQTVNGGERERERQRQQKIERILLYRKALSKTNAPRTNTSITNNLCSIESKQTNEIT